MSAAVILSYEKRARVAGAHADYNRTDFVFRRAQSPLLRDLPWGDRIRPMKSWSEIAMYVGAMLLGALLLVSLVVTGA